jgi:hypothetical protein
MLPWRFWSTSKRVLTIVLPALFAVAVVVLTLIAVQVQSPLPVVGGVAAIIALGSLVSSAWSASLTWTRNRKKDTLEAWEEWSDDSKKDRAAFTKVFGQNVGLNELQAAAICDGEPVPMDNGVLDRAVSIDLRRRIIGVLGGLERIAVGIEQHVFDLDLIMELGGTIVIGTYTRYLPYVQYVQNHPDLDKRKTQVYTSLGALVAEIAGKPAREKRKYFDDARVARIKRATGKPGAS